MPKVFISYSHKDEQWKERVQTHLTVLEMQGMLSIWEDRSIEPGHTWHAEIERALSEASVAILLISANFLTSKFIQNNEVPRLLKRRIQEGIQVIPLVIRPCPWRKVKWLSALQGASKDNLELSGLSEHEQDVILSNLAEKLDDIIQESSNIDPMKKAPTRPRLDKLPTVKGEFFGRDIELNLLNKAWNTKDNNIIQFIAPGGTGKTKLLRHWLDQVRPLSFLAWSFYSQGSNEDRQTSTTLFFNTALELLDPTKTVTDFSREPEKMGEHLAKLLRKQFCLLVLDGLEPLQHADNMMRGEIKDRALKALLKSLTTYHTNLCIITTRIAVHELSDRSPPLVISHTLQNLTPTDGTKLLRSLKVTGNSQDLLLASKEYGCHALALNLLGNILRLRYQGDISKKNTLRSLLNPIRNKESMPTKLCRHMKNGLKANQSYPYYICLVYLITQSN